MSRTALAVVLILCLAYAVGCGGSSSNGGSLTLVDIKPGQFVPKSITVSPGTNVRWINMDTIDHQVVSGTLARTSNPITVGPIEILPSNVFSPNTFEANFGDTVQFSNERSLPFDLEIVDDAGTPVVERTLGAQELVEISDFHYAGRYTYRAKGSPSFKGTLILFGVPTPDGAFQSQPLTSGEAFTHQFNTTGTFDYFDLNQADLARSFMIGSVTVQ